MSVDLESRLREDFGAVPLDVDIDVDAVLAAGRRERARRSGGVIVTFAVVIAAVLVAVPFARGPGRPAVPEPVHTAVPEPVQTARHATAVFDEPIQNGIAPPRVARVVMDVDKVSAGTGERLDVVVTVTMMSGESSEAISGEPVVRSFSRPATEPWEPYKVNDHVYVAVLPSAKWVTFVSSGGGWGSAERQLDGLGLTAVLMVAGDPPSSIDGVIWRSVDGQAHDSLGNGVSAASFRPGVYVYADPALDVVGLDHDGQGAATRLSWMDNSYRAIFSTATANPGDSASWSVFVLPARARIGQVTVKPGFEATTWSAPFEGGSLQGSEVVVVRVALPNALKPSEADTLVESLTFTDATGTVQTVRPGR